MDSANKQEDDAGSFSQLERFAAESIKRRHRTALRGAALSEAFQNALPDCEAVSFDVFDTLLVRRVHQPADVFLHLERADVFLQKGSWPAPLWQLRAKAENQARMQLHQTSGSGEVTLEEIYSAFCGLTGRPRELAAGLARAEEAIELTLCRPSSVMRALLERAVASNKRIIFVSDTYHHARFLRELLAANGFPIAADMLFASSELRLNKQSGLLFPQVLKRTNLKPEAMLHIGDHPASDFQRPRALGIKAILHAHRAVADEAPVFVSAEGAALQSFVRGSAFIESRCHEPCRDFWWLLGHNVFGPLLTGFCLWLERTFRTDRIEHAWFLLRDGEIFQRIHKALFAGRKATSTGTLPSSRRAFLLPAFELSPDLARNGLLSGIGPRPVREFLTRLSLPAEAFGEEFSASGFAAPEEAVDARVDGERLLQLFKQPRVQAALAEKSRQERELIMAFFAQEGLGGNRRTALVDLGWRGSIPKATHLLLSSRGPAMIKGYYLATKTAFAADSIPGLASRSYLMHAGKPDAVAKKLASFPQLLEIVCSNASGSLLYFEKRAGRIEGVFQEADASSEQHRQIAGCHEGIVAFAQEFAKSAPRLKLEDFPPFVAAEALFRVIAQPTKEEATQLGGLTFCDNAGSMTFQHCARFGPTNDPEALMDVYHKTTWKQGLLAQPNAQAATLRTLLWLLQE